MSAPWFGAFAGFLFFADISLAYFKNHLISILFCFLGAAIGFWAGLGSEKE